MKIRRIKNHGADVYMLDLRSVGRGRLHFRTRSEALEVLEGISRRGIEADGISEGERMQWVEYRRKLAAVGATIGDAVDMFLRAGKACRPVPLADAIDACARSKAQANDRARWPKELRRILHHFAGNHPGKSTMDIQRADVERFLFVNNWQPATRRSIKIGLSTFFNFCRRQGWAYNNPVSEVERIMTDPRPPAILTVDECRRLLDATRRVAPSVLPYAVLALFAGIRPEEAQKLTWANVSVERGFVEVPAKVAKGRQRRLVELAPNAVAWLRLGGELPPPELRWRFGRARNAAGITWSHNVLRHSFASYDIAMTGSADKTALKMGHRSTDMLFRHYRELVTPEAAKAFWNLYP